MRYNGRIISGILYAGGGGGGGGGEILLIGDIWGVCYYFSLCNRHSTAMASFRFSATH